MRLWIRKWEQERLAIVGPAVLDEIRAFRTRIPHVQGSLLITCDGLVIADDTGLPSATLTPLARRSLLLGRGLASAARAGDFAELTVRGTEGYLAVYAAGSRTALAVIAGPQVNLGRLHLEAHPVAARVADLIGKMLDPGQTGPGADP